METPSEHEPARRVVFEARPSVPADAPGSFARRTGGLMAVLFTIAVFGLLVLGGNVVWTMVETPERPPAPPSWMKPVAPPEQGAQRDEREATTPRPSTGPSSNGPDDSSGDDPSPSEPSTEDTSGSDDVGDSSGSGSGSDDEAISPGDSSGTGSGDDDHVREDSSGSGSDDEQRRRESSSGSGSGDGPDDPDDPGDSDDSSGSDH